MHRGEQQYLQLIKNIIKNGLIEKGRNGNTLSILGANMRFSLKNNKIPFTTTKRLAWEPCLKELLWFIKGETDNKKWYIIGGVLALTLVMIIIKK